MILPLLADDLVELLLKSVRGEEMPTSVAFKDESAMVVVLASKGYPEAYPKGETITEPSDSPEGCVLIHAGTKEQDGEIVTAGGRVLGAVGIGSTLKQAKDRAYKLAKEVDFESNIIDRISDIANFPEADCILPCLFFEIEGKNRV